VRRGNGEGKERERRRNSRARSSFPVGAKALSLQPAETGFFFDHLIPVGMALERIAEAPNGKTAPGLGENFLSKKSRDAILPGFDQLSDDRAMLDPPKSIAETVDN
jgi:hypothetical protein